MERRFSDKLAYVLRNWRYRELFQVLERYCRGEVLDVGGWDFFLTAQAEGIKFTNWINIEPTTKNLPKIDDSRYKSVVGNGAKTRFKSNRFDTVLNIHVLEHVLEPAAMVKEIARVLKPGGHAIFMIPQTAVLHDLPHNYYNFTKYWIQSVMPAHGLKIVEHQPLGGLWSTTASHMVYFFFKLLRLSGYSDRKEYPRQALFYLLIPFMIVFVVISVPIVMLFALADLTEDPNNHLVVVKKV